MTHGEPRYIGVIRGEGYRLLASVEALPATSQHPVVWYASEILRRQVLQVGLVYMCLSWLLLRGGELVSTRIPAWLPEASAIALGLGLPLVLVLRWRRGEIAAVGPAWPNTMQQRAAAFGLSITLAASGLGLGLFLHPGAQSTSNDIAVLPFAAIGADEAQNYLGVGIAEQLRDQLSGLPELRVVARASSGSIEVGDAELSQVGAQLDVAVLVTGSVERSGSQLDIGVEIVDAGTGTRIWHRRYSGNIDDLLPLQQRLFDDIAAAPGTGILLARAVHAPADH